MRLTNFIGGEERPPADGRYLEVYEPATGCVFAEVPDSGEVDVSAAVDAGAQAFNSWSRLPAEDRSQILMSIADAIEDRCDELANAESTDTGKPVSLARTVDIPRAARNFRFFASACVTFASESHDQPGSAINYTLRRPLGIVGCISPWNLPLYLFTWKIAPALAAGNVVVGKPSELTPLSASLLGQICVDAGLPPGVLNIVHGTGKTAGSSIVSNPDIPGISFTGGTKTGALIAAKAGPLFKKLSLELGGKNPGLIFADCDYEEMLKTTIRSSFSNQGQICLCGSRILVQRPIYERFRHDFVAATGGLLVGDPRDSNVDIGAVISDSHRDKILRYINLARDEGGSILTGGDAVALKGRCSKGWFVEPTVIEGLGQKCRINQDEIFGPVVTIDTFDTEEQAIAMANSTRYGLAATIWTTSLSRAHRVAAAVDAGIVWVNCWMVRDLRTPFGGMKHSGVGREGGEEALRFVTEAKNVCIDLSE